MSVVAATVGGLVYAALITLLAIDVAGGGHGWNSAFISALGLCLLPLAAFAVVRRQRRVAVAAFTAAIIVDVVLVVLTTLEGFQYVQRVLSAAPLLLVTWLFLWLSWQVALLFAIRSERYLPHANT